MAITVKDNLIREREKKDVSNVKVGINSEGKGYLINLDKIKPKVIEESKRGKKK